MRTARITTSLFYLADGLLIGTWASRIPAVEHQAGLTESQLGLALFGAALGALTAMPVSGWLTVQLGSRAVAVGGLLVGSATLIAASFVENFALLALALFGFGAGYGTMNVAVNAQGLAVERRYARSIFSSFHAAFSGGALLGAATGALVAAATVGPRLHFTTVGLVVGTGALAGRSRLLPREADDRRRGNVFVRPPRALMLVGVAAFFALLAEGATADWSAVYLSSSVGAGVAALGYASFSVTMVASRLLGDRLNERLGPVALVRSGGLLAASGLTVALLSASPLAGLAGFAAMGMGLGAVVPVLFRTAGTTPTIASGVGVAAVSTIGWLGFLAGPPAIGLTAGAVGLRTALLIVVLAAMMLAALARSVGPRRRERWAVLSDLDGVLVDSTDLSHRNGGLTADRRRTDRVHCRRAIPHG